MINIIRNVYICKYIFNLSYDFSLAYMNKFFKIYICCEYEFFSNLINVVKHVLFLKQKKFI